VELSGLEPLTSRMPSRAISSVWRAFSPVSTRDTLWGVCLSPVLAARVWVRVTWLVTGFPGLTKEVRPMTSSLGGDFTLLRIMSPLIATVPPGHCL
jgi:hypothetical protein